MERAMKILAFRFWRMTGAAVLAIALSPNIAGAQTSVSEYGQICDASAAVAVDADHFVVADDERNTLQTYRRGDRAPVASLDLSAFLGTEPDKESDLEGAAAIEGRIYWISSHGRNSSGELQKRRRRFFATVVTSAAEGPVLKPIGTAYTELLSDLLAAPQLAPYALKDAASRPPEAKDGLNIEGLAATPDGRLLVGFRNPIPGRKALLVPIENPDDLIHEKKARLGAPIELDLGNRGIRSIELVGSSYLIVAGPPADDGTFRLFRWSGAAVDKPVEIHGVDFDGLSPEALFAVPQTDTVQILSDDGGKDVDGVACKKQKKSQRSFRSIIVTP
jgi:hypothetical protein